MRIPEAEFRARVTRFSKRMDEVDLDALVA